ncbi:unnamed protein product, partial [Rotaria magnacalcarata]
MNSNSLNDIHVANDEFIYAIESVKVNAQVTSDNTDFGTYVFRDLPICFITMKLRRSYG